MCPGLDFSAPHPWVTLRPGVNWCPCCERWILERVENVIPFPTSVLVSFRYDLKNVSPLPNNVLLFRSHAGRGGKEGVDI
jgi:uncharacterized protein (DUF2237 family)